MDLIQAIVLGVLQGVTEWLPISSEAMVTLFGKFMFGFEYSEALSNAIWLHVGTSLSAIIYFRNEIIDIIKSILTRNGNKDLLIFLIITTVLSGVIGVSIMLFLFNLQIHDGLFTILIGLFLLGISVMQKKLKAGRETKLKPVNAILPGIVQGLAIIPGISRSGITTATLILHKYSLEKALKLSFIMSIPVTIGAQFVLPIIKQGFVVSDMMLLSGAVAAITGLVTIKILIEFANKTNFAKATAILGIIVLILGIITFFV